MKFLLPIMLSILSATTLATDLRGTADIGVVVQRSSGQLLVVEHSNNTRLAEIGGLGDLSHASVVFSRDQRFAYVFGRDGALSKVDILTGSLVKRVMQSGNSIGGAISQDGKLVAVSNYEPGGVRVFDADTLDLVADIPAQYAAGKFSKTVGLVDAPGNRFVFSLYEADQIWVVNMTNPRRPEIKRYEGVGKAPYDALITADGRYYIWNSRRAVSGSGCRYATTIVSRFMTRTAWRNWRSCRQANPAGFSLPMVHTKSACNDGTLD